MAKIVFTFFEVSVEDDSVGLLIKKMEESLRNLRERPTILDTILTNLLTRNEPKVKKTAQKVIIQMGAARTEYESRGRVLGDKVITQVEALHRGKVFKSEE